MNKLLHIVELNNLMMEVVLIAGPASILYRHLPNYYSRNAPENFMTSNLRII